MPSVQNNGTLRVIKLPSPPRPVQRSSMFATTSTASGKPYASSPKNLSESALNNSEKRKNKTMRRRTAILRNDVPQASVVNTTGDGRSPRNRLKNIAINQIQRNKGSHNDDLGLRAAVWRTSPKTALPRSKLSVSPERLIKRCPGNGNQAKTKSGNHIVGSPECSQGSNRQSGAGELAFSVLPVDGEMTYVPVENDPVDFAVSIFTNSR